MIWNDSAMLEKKVMDLFNTEDGLSDKEVSEKATLSFQIAGTVCKQLEYKRKLERVKGQGQPIRNYLKK